MIRPRVSIMTIATMTADSTVKGSILIALLQFFEVDLSQVQRDELFAREDPTRALTGRNKVLASDRVPLSLLNRLTVTAAVIKGEPLPSLARRAGRAGAESGLKGVYRLFARILTPAFQLSKAAALWSSVYDRGQVEAIPHGNSGATIKLLDFKTETAMCERIHGWLERMNQMTGAKDTKVTQTRCCSRGDDHCEWEITWT
jgi:hypothetical protein